MKVQHQLKVPIIHRSAFIAPNAMICGDVQIGENVRIMHGSQIIAEDNSISIGKNCIILENAVVRSTGGFPVNIANNCLVGPNAHLVGCTLEDNIFVATGASIFHGAVIEENSEIRINATVHVKSRLMAGNMVPIGWVAVGNPAKILSPGQHHEIWELQKSMEFNSSVYGVSQRPNTESIMPEICKTMAERLGSHFKDQIIAE